MKANKTVFDRLSTLENLPTLPHILLKLFDACNQDSVNLGEIAAIVKKDPALSAKLLKLVNSAYYGLHQKILEIEQAAVYAGTSTIKNMALCACVYEAFPTCYKNGNFNLKAFWWHSLRCAFMAKAIASEMKLENLDEAFISGLLHDIGKLVLWTNFRSDYEELLGQSSDHAQLLTMEDAALGANHCQVGEWLLDHWCFESQISDPIRYHHEPPDRIAQAFPMTQAIWMANRLSHEEDAAAEAIALAQEILAFSPETSLSLVEKSVKEAKEVADALDIDVSAVGSSDSPVIDEKDQEKQEALSRDVQDASLLLGTLQGFMAAEDRNAILSVISDGLKILLDIDRVLFFLFDSKKKILNGYLPDKNGHFNKDQRLAVSMVQSRSLPVRAVLEKRPLHAFHADAQHPPTILDEQMMSLLDRPAVYCIPLVAHGVATGLLALGIRKKDLQHLLKRKTLVNIFLHEGSLALSLNQVKQRQLQEVQSKRIDASIDLARKVVHEVNNPLSIIKNYLKILELKLAEKQIARDEIRIINEEIGRVSDLLGKLTRFSKRPRKNFAVADINQLILDIVSLTKEFLAKQSNVSIQTELGSNLPNVAAAEAELKQVFINLIKNSAEAMVSGGHIHIRTRYVGTTIEDRDTMKRNEPGGYVEVLVDDDGPGIPDRIKEKLFDPYVSSKEEGHSGLGLSIAYSIIRSFNGDMRCESVLGQGTCFRIELPSANHS